MKKRTFTRHLLLALLCIGAISHTWIALSFAQTSTRQQIGKFTHSTGVVTVTHPGQEVAVPIKVRDEVFFRDFIRTGPASKTKALFIDDSILTLGENSTMEITEHVYNPETDKRSVSVGLLSGKMRVLVGKLFKGLGSKFEIHTDTAVVAARGTLFDVWLETPEGRAVPASYSAQAGAPGSGTGVNVHQGVVTISNGINTVDIPAGEFAVAFQGAPIPQPQVSSGNPVVLDVQQSLDIEEAPEPETPTETIENSGQTQTQQVEAAQQTAGPTGGTPPASTTTGGTGSGDSSSGGDGGSTGDSTGGSATVGGDSTGGGSIGGDSTGGGSTGGDSTGGGSTGGGGTTVDNTGAPAPQTDPFLGASSVTTVIDPLGITGENLNNLPSPANIVPGQMELEALKIEAAIEGGRAPQANVNISVTFPK